jgi:hypothetical protein
MRVCATDHFRRFEELFPTKDANGKWMPDRTQSPTLFNVFLDSKQSQQDGTVSFAADICVRASDYEVNKALFFKDHYDGAYLFRDVVTLVAERTSAEPTWAIRYQFSSQRVDGWKQPTIQEDDERLSFVIPIEQTSPPGIRGRLRIETRFWNDWQ